MQLGQQSRLSQILNNYLQICCPSVLKVLPMRELDNQLKASCLDNLCAVSEAIKIDTSRYQEKTQTKDCLKLIRIYQVGHLKVMGNKKYKQELIVNINNKIKSIFDLKNKMKRLQKKTLGPKKYRQMKRPKEYARKNKSMEIVPKKIHLERQNEEQGNIMRVEINRPMFERRQRPFRVEEEEQEQTKFDSIIKKYIQLNNRPIRNPIQPNINVSNENEQFFILLQRRQSLQSNEGSQDKFILMDSFVSCSSDSSEEQP